MPLFRSKKKSAQAATPTVNNTSNPPKLVSNAGYSQSSTAAGAARPLNNVQGSVPSIRASSHPIYPQTIDASRHEIRLLEVLPGAFPLPIKCILRPVSLLAATAPQYETVSYCWGQSRRGFPINLNGRRWMIEDSAGCVLHRFRLPDRSRMIWIDAVCINQDDDTEKGQQVSIMGDIYRCARQNIVYLGEFPGIQEAVQSTLSAVLADMKKKIPKDTSLFELTHGNARPGQHRMSNNGNLMDPKINLKPLRAVYSDPWFGRIWVVQEVALAPISICYVGTAEFLLSDILKIAVWLLWHEEMIWPHSVIPKQGLARASNIWHYADHDAVLKSSYQQATRTLTSICMKLETHESSNPKDKIYALLGLHGRWRARGWQIITPRYEETVSVSEVYQEATRVMIEESMSLEILQYRCPRAEKPLLPNTPSWVIDFTRMGGRDIKPRHLNFRFATHDGRAIKECTFKAPRDSPVLPLVGFTLDRVQSRTCTIEDRQGPYIPELGEILKLSQQLRRPYRETEKQLSRTLIADRDANGGVAGPRSQDAYFTFMSLCNDNMSLMLNDANRKPSKAKKQLVLLGGHYFNSFQLACIGRCFFLTKGGLMGIGPADLADGDTIAVLYGGKVPFALSPTGGRDGYRLLGECYVDGVMQGQGMQKHKAAGRRDEVFNVV